MNILFIDDFFEISDLDKSLMRIIFLTGSNLILGIRNAYKSFPVEEFIDAGQRIEALHQQLVLDLPKHLSVFYVPLPDLRNSLAPSLKAYLLWSFQAITLAPKFDQLISNDPIERMTFEKLGYQCFSPKIFQKEFDTK